MDESRCLTERSGKPIWIRDFFCGQVKRSVLVFCLIPLIFLSFFGTLAATAWLYPGNYDWRARVISDLLSPRHNPGFHSLASVGLAVSALLTMPFVGYLHARLRPASQLGARIGAGAFSVGLVALILAGLIVSPHSAPPDSIPRLHEMLGRTSAAGLGAGMLLFCWCALKGQRAAPDGRRLYQRRLLLCWVLLALPPLLGAVASESLWLISQAHYAWSYPINQALKTTLLWHLAFWEWIGAAAVFLFLLSSALLLPAAAEGGVALETSSGRNRWER